MPRKGHLDQVLHIFAYLKKCKSSKCVFDASNPSFGDRFKPVEWEEFYPDTKEDVPHNMPAPRGNEKQNTVESSTFGSEFVAMKTAAEQNMALRYKLRMFGIPIDGPANVFCDNEAADDDEQQRLDRRLTRNGLRPEPRRCSACLWATTVILIEDQTEMSMLRGYRIMLNVWFSLSDPTLSGEVQGCSNDSNDLCVISESMGRLITISTVNMKFRGANLASNQRNTTHSLPRIIPLNGTVLVRVLLLGFA
eukprot:scaffold24349_cov63-Attheya_sp.AAC.1